MFNSSLSTYKNYTADDTPAHAESVKFLTTDVMKGFNNMAEDNYHTSQSNLMATDQHQQQHQRPPLTGGQQQAIADGDHPQQQQRQPADEMSQDLQYLSHEAPLDGGESTFGAFSQLGGAHSTTGGSQRDEQSSSVLRINSDDQLNYNEHDDANEDLVSSSQRFGTESPFNYGDPQQQQQQQQELQYSPNDAALEQLAPDNVDIQRPLRQAGAADGFEGHPDQRRQQLAQNHDQQDADESAQNKEQQQQQQQAGDTAAATSTVPRKPYLRRERLVHPPPLMEGEACASKILEVGPAGAKFLGPVLIEVPHFASLRGKEREIIILRSDSGEVWREHLVETDKQLVDSIIRSAEEAEREQQRLEAALSDDQADENNKENNGGQQQGARRQSSGSASSSPSNRRLTRIITTEFPQYFAIITRIRQEVHVVGPEGAVVDSQLVPKVQAVFTEKALTKRIKIGLQPNKKKNQQDQQQQQDNSALATENAASERAQSPSASSQVAGEEERTQSPESQKSQSQRPGSATKRRRRFLACFGASQGSEDLLDQSATSEGSSAGGDSPRQVAKEKLVKCRHILEDVCDSETEQEGNSLSDGELGASHMAAKLQKTRGKRQLSNATAQLVPEDYYIEREPQLILNCEPKTYGKRMASSSAQTDSKLQMNGFMSTSTRKNKKRGLLGKRRHKTQMIIHCDAPPPAAASLKRPKSAAAGDLQAAAVAYDESLAGSQTGKLNGRESTALNGSDGLESQEQPQVIGGAFPGDKQSGSGDTIETASIIQDVVTSDDQKWRTCTIQTDSDSVTINYVTFAQDPSYGGAAAASTQTQAATGQDDGYVSGSGELKSSSFGKSIFSPFCASIGEADQQETAPATTDGSKVAPLPAEQIKKARGAKKDKKSSKKRDQEEVADSKLKQQQQQQEASAQSQSIEQQASSGPESITALSVDSASAINKEAAEQSAADSSLPVSLQETSGGVGQLSGGEEAGDESLTATATTTRSLSPTSKELKAKEKRERQERIKREKLEKQKAKELEEAAARAEKLKRKQEKEQAKAAAKAEKAAAKKSVAATAASASAADTTATAAPREEAEEVRPSSPTAAAVASKPAQSVTFASEVETSSIKSGHHEKAHEQAEAAVQQQQQQLAQPVRQSSSEERDSRTLESAVGGGEEAVATKLQDKDMLISFSDNDDISQSAVPEASDNQQVAQQQQQQQQVLKPILKQQQSQESTASDKSLTKVVSRLVDEATSEAVVQVAERATRSEEKEKATEATAPADSPGVKSAASDDFSGSATITQATTSASESKKEAAKRLKAEKARLKEEAKRRAKEAKEAKQAAELEAKRLAQEAKAEAEKAKVEAARLAKEAKLESERLAKEAAEAKRAADAEAKRLAKEAKKAAKKSKSAEKGSPVSGDSSGGKPQESSFLSTAAVIASAPTEEAINVVEQKPEGEQVDSSVVEVNNKPEVGPEAAEVYKEEAAPAPEVDVAEEKVKRGKKGKKRPTSKPEAAVAAAAADDTEHSQSSLGETASKSSSFLGRLFRRNRSAAAAAHVVEKGEAQSESCEPDQQVVKAEQQNDEKPIIVSEMYPSDPDNADGEMILEVNVPESLINGHREVQLAVADGSSQQVEQANEAATSQQQLQQQTLTVTDTEPTTAEQDDQEATLVNISQMPDEDEATENVVSQSNDLLGGPEIGSPHSAGYQLPADEPVPSSPVEQEAKQEAAAPDTIAITDGLDGGAQIDVEPQHDETSTTIENVEPRVLPADVGAVDTSKEAPEDKREENDKTKESPSSADAKKRAKEEEKERKLREKEEKKQAKEAKKLAEIEAKKAAQEEKKRVKREAQEASKLAELAKKQAKEDRKRAKEAAKKSKKLEKKGEIEAQDAAASASTTKTEATSAAGQSGQQQVVDDQTAEGDNLILDTSNMQPVNTETEVERIVEEVVEDDGTVTKTTRTIETKYVTMRAEEMKMAERRDMPLEEWERLQAAERAAGEAQRVSRASSEIVVVDVENQSSRPTTTIAGQRQLVVPPYEHAELDAIRATPSYFDQTAELPAGVIKPEWAPKKALKKRFKLNKQLIKRARSLAKSEAKRAKREERRAESEIAVCDEAARQARKQLKRALKEAKKAKKRVAKLHKQMDKEDKKLTKGAKKIEKRQKKLDKRAEKLAKKEAKRLAKQAKKAGLSVDEFVASTSNEQQVAAATSSQEIDNDKKKEEKRSSSSSKKAKKVKKSSSASSSATSASTSSGKKSIKREDIGEPILRSSSRLSIGAAAAGAVSMQEQQQQPPVEEQQVGADSVGRNNEMSLTNSGDDLHVDMSLEDNLQTQPRRSLEVTLNETAAALAGNERNIDVHTYGSPSLTDDGQQVFSEQEAADSARLAAHEASEVAMCAELAEAQEELDVVDAVGDSSNLKPQNHHHETPPPSEH